MCVCAHIKHKYMFVMQSAEFANILDGVIQKWTVLI